MILRRFNLFQSADVAKSVDFIEKFLNAKIYYPKKLKRAAHTFICNSIFSHNLHIFYVENNMTYTIVRFPSNHIHLVFQIEGSKHISIDDNTVECSKKTGGYIIPDGILVEGYHKCGSKCLVLRISSKSLKQKFEELTHTKIDGKITFKQPTNLNSKTIRYLRQIVFNTAHEIDTIDMRYHAHILEELSNVVLTRLLLHLEHNYSYLLAGKVFHTTAHKIKKVEDYIKKNPSKSLGLKSLSSISKISSRTIQRHFEKMYNLTPREYIQRERLDIVREKLLKDKKSSVLSVALSCGFKSFGHFSRLYKNRFGELPSATLKRIT